MKRKYLFLAIVVLLAVGGLWLARTAWRTDPPNKSSTGFGVKRSGHTSENPDVVMDGRVNRESRDIKQSFDTNAAQNDGQGRSMPRHVPRPPVPNRRFTDFTPEQRVDFARKGRGPGG